MSKNDVLIDGWRSTIESQLVRVEQWTGRAQPGSALHAACRYVSEGGGKRLRGLLAYAVAYDLTSGGDAARAERALSSAVALELLHAASLVHDDLPALDNDDFRRGRESCHKAFGEATAILTGDALVGAAFVVVTGDAGLPSDSQARVTRTLAHAWWDLCLGQQFDIEQQRGVSGAGRKEMIALKTGALFGAAVGCGAVCAGIREAALGEYIDWGRRVGECFQALDDLDDGERDSSERVVIEQECHSVLEAVSGVDSRLATGVTQSVVRRIVNKPGASEF